MVKSAPVTQFCLTHLKHAETAVKRNTKPQRQAGVMLIEALVAILIFTVGILGIVGLQAVSIKQGTDSRYRSDAAMLANQLIGTMWLGNRTVAYLKANYSTGMSRYATWQAIVDSALPGTTLAGNAPTVTIDDYGNVTIQINWIAPNEPVNATPHTYFAVAKLTDTATTPTSN